MARLLVLLMLVVLVATAALVADAKSKNARHQIKLRRAREGRPWTQRTARDGTHRFRTYPNAQASTPDPSDNPPGWGDETNWAGVRDNCYFMQDDPSRKYWDLELSPGKNLGECAMTSGMCQADPTTDWRAPGSLIAMHCNTPAQLPGVSCSGEGMCICVKGTLMNKCKCVKLVSDADKAAHPCADTQW